LPAPLQQCWNTRRDVPGSEDTWTADPYNQGHLQRMKYTNHKFRRQVLTVALKMAHIDSPCSFVPFASSLAALLNCHKQFKYKIN